MAAPKLNLEIKDAVNDYTLKKDERLANIQAQVGADMVALGKILTILFESKEVENASKLRLTELISDSAKLLADVHHQDSDSRRNLVSLKLKKDLISTIDETGVDGWLFGENLADRVKAAQTIERSGQDLKNVSTKPTTSKRKKNARVRLNYRGPSRHLSGCRLDGQKYDRDRHPRGHYQDRLLPSRSRI
ncbi:hypothetical protein NQ314_008189 [Rhamnusium bicolor]|uniref:Uncharacterized protein n=1 Tax=Rhamnusium bicolor TaxID=1586634 RepID=A0AAV8YDV1_9CUCU|nr:hypothetical protein NQ314_008189 [Rhamnusium bicolor]